MEWITPYIIPVLQIIWIDLLLSGDNAVVIALACRQLPPRQRKIGMLMGAGAAIGLRILFAVIVTWLLGVPFLKVVGGLLLLWIGIKLAVGENNDAHEIEASDHLWRAVRTIAIADAVMSLDNVIAISAAAGGNIWLFIFGLLLSIPLIIFGSALLSTIIDRFPIVVWMGAALLGWIAGEMIVGDVAMMNWFRSIDPGWIKTVLKSDGHGGQVSLTEPVGWIHYGAAAVGALIVIGIGWVMKRRNATAEA